MDSFTFRTDSGKRFRCSILHFDQKDRIRPIKPAFGPDHQRALRDLIDDI
jgi:hypothetical protein